MLQEGQRFCLKWNNYHSSLTSLLDTLREMQELVDVTLCCQGRQLRAHRLVLSACSPYFREVLRTHPGDPVFFFKDAEFDDLVAIIEFIYSGQVNVDQKRFTSFLAVAEMLKIKGLAKDACGDQGNHQVEPHDLSGADSCPASPGLAGAEPPPERTQSPPPAKRRRRLQEAASAPPAPLSDNDTAEEAASEEDDELAQPFAQHAAHAKKNGVDSFDAGNDESLTEMMDIQGSSGLVEKKFVCRVCSRTYANLMTFRQHFESHKLSIQCWVCRKLCSRVTNLNAHLRNKHGVLMKQSELRKILKYMEHMGVSAVAEAMAAGRLLAEPPIPDPAEQLAVAPASDSCLDVPIGGAMSEQPGDDPLNSDT